MTKARDLADFVAAGNPLADGTIDVSDINGVTATVDEINYLDGVTSNIQTQFDGIIGVPSGVIAMWSGSIASIPTGWALCDGTNSTPDLRDRFIVGAGSTYAVADTGGAANVTLTESEIPSHTHTVSGTTDTTGAHTHNYSGTSSGTRRDGDPLASTAIPSGTVATSSAGDHSHTVTGTAAATGGGSAHENRPPYYALAYIMKT